GHCRDDDPARRNYAVAEAVVVQRAETSFMQACQTHFTRGKEDDGLSGFAKRGLPNLAYALVDHRAVLSPGIGIIRKGQRPWPPTGRSACFGVILFRHFVL